MKRLNYKVILADLDGTINRGSILLPGVSEIYDELSLQGLQWFFLSNNASVLDVDLFEKIRGWGFSITHRQVVNSASVLTDHIRRHVPGIRLMVVGQQRLAEACINAGALISSDPKLTDAVVVALDRNFTYQKMKMAHKAIQYGARFWATNLDATYPDEENFSPGAGSIVASIAEAAGFAPERVFGKPSPNMAEIVLDRTGVEPSECLVVGDRIDTDMMFARNSNMDCALVLSGATTREILKESSFTPDYVLDDITFLKDLFR